MRRAASAAVRASVCLALTACSGFGWPMWIDVPARSGVDPTQPGVFRAGAYAVDITPIPGVPLGGQSIDGKASRGFWTRLRARAVYLSDARGTPLVLVSTDLGAIPGGLGDEVTRLLHQEHKLPWIGREHLLLAATHTHHGPGNFYTATLWNDTISPRTGFDVGLFHFLARRIAFAIARAQATAAPAELLATDAGALEVSKLWKLHDFFRNRSLPAFLLNPRADSLLDSDVPTTCAPWPGHSHPADAPDPRVCTAVRPQVELLAIRDAASQSLLGVAAFTAVHPTVLPPRLEVYSGDLFAVASARLEGSATCPAAKGAVVAFFNGAEGDVSPTWTNRDRDEVLDLGQRLADRVCTLLGHLKPVSSPGIGFGFERLDLASKTVEGDTILDAGSSAVAQHRTAGKGSPGAAAAGGAEDGRSSFHELLGHREGKTLVARREQGPKSKVGQIEGMGLDFDMLSLWRRPPPRQAPLAVYRIGDTAPNVVLVAVPGELTTQMGARARRAVWNAIPSGRPRPAKPDHILLVGLANEYIGYFSTPEEYDAQHYEGAMTLWGAASGPLLTHEAAALAGTGTNQPEAPKAWSTPWYAPYFPGARKRFEPKEVWGTLHFKDDGLADLLTRSSRVRRDLPVFCWRDAVPRLEASALVQTCQRSNPEVSVQEQPGATQSWAGIADNFGLELVTAVTGVGRDATGTYHTEWCAVWLGAADRLESFATRRFQFEVQPLRGGTLQSHGFTLVDADGDGWADDRFLEHPAHPLDPDFPAFSLAKADQCTVPGP